MVLKRSEIEQAVSDITAIRNMVEGVYLDVTGGESGTDFPIGTPGRPVDNLADARTIAAARKTRVIKIVGTGVVTLDAAMNEYIFIGEDAFNQENYIDINSKDVDNSTFTKLRVKGVMGGTGYYPYFIECVLSDITFKGWAWDCILEDTFTFADGVDSDMYNCRPLWASVNIHAGDGGNITFHDWSGGMNVSDLLSGQFQVNAASGDINPGSSCVGGSVVITGACYLLDGTSPGCTVNDLRAIVREMHFMDFWSAVTPLVSLTDAAAPGTDVALPDVTIADLEQGRIEVIRVVAMLKFRAIEDTSGNPNKLSGTQYIQVRSDAPGTWYNAITLVDDLFGIGANAREGGDVVMGDLNLIDSNPGMGNNNTYNFQWDASLVDGANLQFNDVQTGLRVYFR